MKRDGVNNFPNLTDAQTARLGATMYFNFHHDSDIDEVMMDSDNFVDDDYNDADGIYRDSVNGDFDRKEIFGAHEDKEFDYFLTKKMNKRRKRKKELRKDEGLSRKEARKKAVEEIPREKLGEVLKKGFKAIGKGIVVATMAIPRGGFLACMALNYRGMATKMDKIFNDPKYKSKRDKVKEKWYKFGGKFDRLKNAVEKGKNKKPFLCGKKCKSKLAEKVTSNFTGADGRQTIKFNKGAWANEVMKMYQESIDNAMFYNVEPTTTASVAVASAGAIIGAMTPILKGVAETATEAKANKEAQAEVERSNRAFEAQASEAQKAQLALAEEQIRLQADPKNAILNNDALTADEKREALAVLDETLQSEEKGKMKKYLLYGALGLVGLIAIGFIAKKK